MIEESQGARERRRVLDTTPIGEKLVVRPKDSSRFPEPPRKRDVVYRGKRGSKYFFSPVGFEYKTIVCRISELDSCHRIY